MRRIIIGIILIAGTNIYAQTYNPQKAQEYAQFWCNKRNTVNSPNKDIPKWGGPYRNYGATGPDAENLGGDCANFMSQCFIYGGLNLSAGIVDGYGCIPSATNLLTHLIQRQDTDTALVIGNNPPNNFDVGDAMFVVNPVSMQTSHSFFCSSLNGNIRLYSMHSSDYCDVDVTNWSIFPNESYMFIHIHSPIPAHCGDCKQNHGETGIDCGGPCPPCEDAEDNVNYEIDNSNLPNVTRAIARIEAGNADVQVLAGQNVSFLTNGTIVLKPGFMVESGGNFTAEIKNTRKDITRYCPSRMGGQKSDCGKYCPPARHYFFCRDKGDYFHWGDVINAVKYSVEIYQRKGNNNTNFFLIYNYTDNISANGTVNFWDLHTGMYTSSWLEPWDTENFWYKIDIIDCLGDNHPYEGYFKVSDNCQKSYNGNEDEDDDDIIPYDTSTNEVWKAKCTILPNPNDGSFTIKTSFDKSEIESIQVLNTFGQVIYLQTSPVNSLNIHLPEVAKGHYVVKMATKTDVIVRKIVVN
ncbi:MAG: T9SS type A sorting domain-containing protein [Lentimicrobiaceae bacterium]|nr:T9SS type A sorting domain-containing protein [Lentimicrobiaceae bacterium]